MRDYTTLGRVQFIKCSENALGGSGGKHKQIDVFFHFKKFVPPALQMFGIKFGVNIGVRLQTIDSLLPVPAQAAKITVLADQMNRRTDMEEIMHRENDGDIQFAGDFEYIKGMMDGTADMDDVDVKRYQNQG